MDRREAILVRLLAICQAVPGITVAARGLAVLDDDKLPALALHDGHELAEDTDPTVRPNRAPRRVVMSPQLLILAQAPAESLGAMLNGFRAALVKAIVFDAALLSLTLLGEGSARYQGCALVLAEGRATEGTLAIDFTITYVLRPDELED